MKRRRVQRRLTLVLLTFVRAQLLRGLLGTGQRLAVVCWIARSPSFVDHIFVDRIGLAVDVDVEGLSSSPSIGAVLCSGRTLLVRPGQRVAAFIS